MMSVAASERAAKTLHVVQGEFEASNAPDVMMTTVLGSCIAVCLYDPKNRVGGMNHFLLPGGQKNDTEGVVYGVHAMELLINALLKRGARKGQLQAKVFGGARMINASLDIGAQNADFAASFLEREGINCVGRSTGGLHARRVRFWPYDGRARQLLLGAVEDASVKSVAPQKPAVSDDIELF